MTALARFSEPARVPRPEGEVLSADDGLDAFLSETEPARPQHGQPDYGQQPETSESGGPARSRRVLISIAIALVVVVTGGYAATRWLTGPNPTGSVRIETEPAGATITVEGTVRGTTPATLELPAGNHQITVVSGDRSRVLAVDVVRGATLIHHLELPAPPVSQHVATGGLQVTAPAAAAVTVDGTARGSTPLTLDGLSPGAHQVVVTMQGTAYRRTIQVDANRTVSLVIGEVATGVAAGWLSIQSAIPLTISEDGAVIGTTASERIMLPAGAHQLDLSNDQLGYATTRRVVVEAGRVASVPLTLPQVPVQINALPWAEVWIDGQRIGETPIANVMQPIGAHEIVFRHPQLGERRLTTMVTSGGPAIRATVDMRAR